MSFIPFAETCLGVGGDAPPPPPSPQMDGFLNLYDTCASMNSNSPREVAALLGDVNELVDNDHCIIETSNIHSASITASNSRPIDIREQNGGGNTCIDDDAFIQSAFSNPDLGCAQVAGQGLCPMLADSGIENRAPPSDTTALPFSSRSFIRRASAAVVFFCPLLLHH